MGYQSRYPPKLHRCPRAAEVQLEHKLFLLELGQAGKAIHITERSRNASYVFDIDLGDARWIWEQLRSHTLSPNSCASFNRTRGRSGVFTIQKFVNKRGSFLEITKLGQQGHRQCFILPSGRNIWGW